MFKLKISMLAVIPLLTVMLFASALYGSDTTSLAHTWALQFRISSNFMLSSFQGSNLSAQYYLKDNRAIRMGFSLWGDINNSETDDINSTGENEHNQSGFSLALFSQYLIYSKQAKNICPYFGIGPNLSFSASYAKVLIDSNRMSLSKKFNTSLGIVASIGGEVYVCKSISLCAEYGTKINYYYSKTNLTDKTRTNINDSWGIQSQDISTGQGLRLGYESVLFGVSIHF